ncbi:2-hydroxyacyl-CoA dehydratase family protein [Agromyces sp. NPDC049794]|uniref:2-hydroxyacyl-CoA dehydratase family protein n=1 Tax=unclassified Agromyces TaxID=2639701 RepID=UPI0033EAC88B
MTRAVEATAALATAYAHRFDGAVVAGAPPRIGVVGGDLARQLVLAAGALPMRLWHPGVHASDEAARLLGATDAASAAVLTGFLGGSFDGLAGVVVCNDCQASLRLFYVLRELRERGRLTMPVHLFDLQRGGRAPTRAFNRFQFERLVGVLTAWTGNAITEEGLADAAADELALGAALRRLTAARRAHGATLSGTTALHAFGVAASLPPRDSAALIDAVVETTVERADIVRTVADSEHEPPLRLLVSGSTHPDDELSRFIERGDRARIVGDDHGTGEGAWLGVAAASGTDIVEGLLALHEARPPESATATIVARVEWMRRHTSDTGADAVLVLTRRHDEAPLWDFPALRRALAADGIPAELLRSIDDGAGDAMTAIDAALVRLRAGVARASHERARP